MDMEFWGALAPIIWVGDRFSPQDAKPRHIGRVISADKMLSSDPSDYTSERVLGTLEGVLGDDLIISGELISYHSLSNVKVYRREIKK